MSAVQLHRSEPIATGSVIADRYRVLEQIGEGGAARVFRVFDPVRGTEVALKRCRTRDDGQRARRLALFRHEYHTLKQLSHPGIVRAYDYDYDVADGSAHYTMELVEGKDAREIAPRPFAEVCSLLRDVASSLAMLHARRLVHRDVSYRNVRCTPKGRAKLIDFGAMTTAGTVNEVIGTPPFLAPESLRQDHLDQRADLYSLGALAYWLLTARHAYAAPSVNMLRHAWGTPPAPPSALVADIPAELDRLVLSLLCVEPERRPSSAAEVMERLSAIAGLPPAEDLRVASAYLATPALVGRTRQLARVRAVLRDPSAREALLIEGTEGTGKSRLIEELSIAAKLDGAVVVRTAAARNTTGRYGVIRPLITQLSMTLTEPEHGLHEADRALIARELPDLIDGGPGPAATDVPADELRHRMTEALCAWLRTMARDRRVVILVDDFHHADEESASVLASLVAERVDDGIRLAVSLPPADEHDGPAVQLLRKAATRVRLHELSKQQTARLIESLFGATPNVSRLSHWIYERTHGNPLGCVELARDLVDRELIAYTEGTWVIPSALPASVGEGLLGTRMARVQALPSEQRAVAEALSIMDGAASLELCAAVAEVEEPEAFAALDGLRRLELADLRGDAYVFRVEALRRAVLESIDPARLRFLHERAGQLLHAQGTADLPTAIEAAHHLLRGVSHAEGAELVLAIARDPTIDRDIGERFTRPLELALQHFEREGRSPVDTTPLRHRLLNAAFMYDRTLVRHADALLQQLKYDAGFDLLDAAELATPRWRELMLQRGGARYRSLPEQRRGLPPEQALQTISAISGITLAAAILNWDIQLIERIWELAEPLAGLGHRSALAAVPELVGLYVGGLRVGEASEHEPRLSYIARLRDPTMYAGLPEARRESVLSTQLHNVGMAAAVLDGATSLRLADEIDALGMQMYAGAAMQVRYMVHMYRGEAEAARDCLDKLDLLALRGGAGVQFELWLAPYLADPYALWGDVMGLKHAASQLERLAHGFEGYAPMALIAAGHYHRERGHLGAALEAFERARALAPRDRHGAWLLALAGYVETLIAAGDPEGARALASEVLDDLHYRERFRALITRRLSPSLVLALAQLGRFEDALAMLDRELAAEEALGRSPLLLGRLHELRARVALLQGDEAAFELAAVRTAELFSATRNPVLIARSERLLAAAKGSFSPVRDADGELDLSSSSLARVRTELESIAPGPARAGRALELILRDAGSSGGFLYQVCASELTLAGAAGLMQSPPPALHAMLTEITQAFVQSQDVSDAETTSGEIALTTTTLTIGRDCFHPHFLSCWTEGKLTVAGVAVLAFDKAHAKAPGAPLLRTIAQCLWEPSESSPLTEI